MPTKDAPKLHDYSYYGFNIKVFSNERKGTAMYEQIINDLFKKDIVAIVAGEKAVTLRTQFSTEVPLKNEKTTFFYGKITRYTTLDGKNWYDKVKKDFVNYEVPLAIFPNAFETDYIFIPAAHRFFIRVSQKVSISAVERYLTQAIPEVITAKESFTVSVIQSQDVIDKIINAKELNSLKVEISYTNDDVGPEAQELIDKLLKGSNVGKFSATFNPDQTGVLDTNADFVRGVLELAKENGIAEASIRNDNGKKVKVKTSSYPEKITTKSPQEDVSMIDLLIRTMAVYRNE